MDEDSVASNRSVGSVADTNSLASEDISALVVDVNAGSKPVAERDADKDAANETDDEAETETEIEKLTNHRSRPRGAAASKASNGAVASAKKPAAAVGAEGDTTDSGVQLSDS